ncbi:MAG: hypothetical protein ACR2K5_12965 [Pseudolabrys sp.]
MRRFLRKIVTFAIVAGLALGGNASHSYAKITAMSSAAAALHESHGVQHYADLAIEADDDCPHARIDASPQHSHDERSCKECCAACMGASLLPSPPLSGLMLSGGRQAFSALHNTLVAHSVPTDPGIPKTL